jgi:hypothetical protein
MIYVIYQKKKKVQKPLKKLFSYFLGLFNDYGALISYTTQETSFLICPHLEMTRAATGYWLGQVVARYALASIRRPCAAGN